MIRPLGENVLIQPVKPEKKTATGIYLPETASEERRQEGKVVALGNSKDIAVKKGERVLFKRYGSSEEVEVAGEEYILVNHKDILAVIEK
ncbi:MAG: co-chaperone GroES [Candidatus Moraniibacteriota bacterium]|nr:MAG: co-chaperone GroES [Candidatus Moranbacteria bacterium]